MRSLYFSVSSIPVFLPSYLSTYITGSGAAEKDLDTWVVAELYSALGITTWEPLDGADSASRVWNLPVVTGSSGKQNYEYVGQLTKLSDGKITCSTYCGGTGSLPYNMELPVKWDGARCFGTNVTGVDCFTNVTTGSLGCYCEPTGMGWNS